MLKVYPKHSAASTGDGIITDPYCNKQQSFTIILFPTVLHADVFSSGNLEVFREKHTDVETHTQLCVPTGAHDNIYITKEEGQAVRRITKK